MSANSTDMGGTCKAIADDRFRAHVIYKLLIPWAQACPRTRITVENPKHSLFYYMPDVIDLINTPSPSLHTAWHVNTIDYCKLYDPAVDPPTAQKSTTLVTYGYQPFTVKCTPASRCNLMLPDGIHHRYCIHFPSARAAVPAPPARGTAAIYGCARGLR